MKKPINSVRIEVPRNPKEKIELSRRIFDANKALGNASPLTSIDWTSQDANITKAGALNKKAEDLTREIEKIYEDRDALLVVIDDMVKQSRDILKGVYRKEPFKLGEFGFNVNSTPQKPKKAGTV
ncbi:MAG: hypothetical protein HXX18_05860 [Bacteroidetes bacterium]|nr:hypothetical protein [Bacteroidota bacterium]